MYSPHVVYEDNHLIAVNKKVSELVQGDRTGDVPMNESLKEWLKQKYNKPGNVYLGVIHRIDRPVSGVILFAKTGKGLSRMNRILKSGNLRKIYWAIVAARPEKDADTIVHYLRKDENRNKSYAFIKPVNGAKEAILGYKIVHIFKRYFMLEIDLKTGRHHQIRCQMAKLGCPILGDLKYGFPRSLQGGGIGLHSREISFIHPVTSEPLVIKADPSGHVLWDEFMKQVKGRYE